MRRHTGSRGRALRARLAVGAMGVGLVLAFAAPAAHADTCAITDLTCIANQGGNTVGGVADKGKDTLGGIVHNGKDSLGGVVDKGKDIVGGVVHKGEHTVGGVIDKGKDTVNRVLRGRSGGGGSGGGGSGGSGGSGAPGAGSGRTGGGFTISDRTFSTSHTTTGTSPAADNAAAHQHRSSLLRSIGGTVATTARQLGFPMILAIVVALFVALQNRLDRHDPKLAKAPLTPDRMRFV